MKPSLLDRFQIIPYELELRDTLDAAQFHFDRLNKLAAETMALQDAAKAAGKPDATVHGKQGQSQSFTFDALEAFLTSFARISLLVFPTSKSKLAKARGLTMAHCLKLDEKSPIADREFRDSWMHHDERLDTAVELGVGRSGQTFTRSIQVTPATVSTYMRVLELDTLAVHYRARDGSFRKVDLHSIAAALKALDKGRVGAFEDLPVPPGFEAP